MINGNDRIENWMTPSPYTISAEVSLKFAGDAMRTRNVRHLPVLKRGELVGVLSERNVSAALASHQGERFIVDDVMMPDVFTVAPDTPLSQVAEVMAKEKYGSAIVQHPTSGKAIGIFTTLDACRALAESLKLKAA
jgi:acetoin utilization protein AcuB